ncbi:MAG: hypothetical protein J6S14_19840 [Clostridia bacterium]|nr:hypothetical protein [Clostridia bacterium]
MADEYIKKDKIIRHIEIEHGVWGDQFGAKQIVWDIKAMKAEEVAPVIRCEHCDNWNEWDHSGHKSLGNFRCSCAYWTVEDGPTFYTAPTDFCSYAEPRDPHES